MSKKRPSTLPLRLLSVYVQASASSLSPEFNPTVSGQQVAGQMRMTPNPAPRILVDRLENDTPDTALTFVTRFEFRYSRVSSPLSDREYTIPDDQVCASISVDLAVEYRLEGDNLPTEKELESWAEGVALGHAWPYWREFCHSTMLRMQLPVIMVPLLNIVPVETKKPLRKRTTENSSPALP